MSPARKEVDTDTYKGRCAARLSTLRKRKGLSVEDVAKAVGVKVRNVYNWEAAKTEPKQEMLPLLADALGIKSPRSVLSEH